MPFPAPETGRAATTPAVAKPAGPKVRASGTPRAAAACRSIARTLAEAHSYERSFAINPEVASGGRRSERLCHELLRIAKIAATKLNLTDALIWIDRELKGTCLSTGELPPYRQTIGRPEAFNTVHGWWPIQFESTETVRIFGGTNRVPPWNSRKVRFAQSGGSLTFPYPPERAAGIQKAIGFQVPVQIAIARAQLSNIVEQVRNLILNWSLELEKAGILGEHMQFSEQEKGDAKPLTRTIHHPERRSTRECDRSCDCRKSVKRHCNNSADLGEVRNFLKQAMPALLQLPRSDQEK